MFLIGQGFDESPGSSELTTQCSTVSTDWVQWTRKLVNLWPSYINKQINTIDYSKRRPATGSWIDALWPQWFYATENDSIKELKHLALLSMDQDSIIQIRVWSTTLHFTVLHLLENISCLGTVLCITCVSVFSITELCVWHSASQVSYTVDATLFTHQATLV